MADRRDNADMVDIADRDTDDSMDMADKDTSDRVDKELPMGSTDILYSRGKEGDHKDIVHEH